LIIYIFHHYTINNQRYCWEIQNFKNMAEHSKGARPSTYQKHTDRTKTPSKQKKGKSPTSEYVKNGSPKGQRNKQRGYI
jgi:hypothetical protein